MGKGGGTAGSDVEALRRSLRSAVDQLCDETAGKAPTALVHQICDEAADDLRAEFKRGISEAVDPLLARLRDAEAQAAGAVTIDDVTRMVADNRAQIDEELRGARADCADAVARVASLEERLGACESLLQEHADIVPRVPEHGERLVQAEAGLDEQGARSDEVAASMQLLQAQVDKSERRLEGVETSLQEMGASLVDVKSREAELNAELARASASAAAASAAAAEVPPPPPPAPATYRSLHGSAIRAGLDANSAETGRIEKGGVFDVVEEHLGAEGETSAQLASDGWVTIMSSSGKQLCVTADASGAPPPAMALPEDLKEKLAMVDSLDKKLSLLGNLSSEIDQIHTTQRETRHELVLLKRDEGSLSNSLADTKQHLNRMQSALDQLSDTIAADVSPFTSRLRSLPTALEQIERKLQAMGEWQEGERQSLVAQLNGKADKSVIAPVQKALVMIRDMLFDTGHRKCAAGRAQFRCLTCDKLQSELQGSLGNVATGRLTARLPSPTAETLYKYGPARATARRAESTREAGLKTPQPPANASASARPVHRPGTAPPR